MLWRLTILVALINGLTVSLYNTTFEVANRRTYSAAFIQILESIVNGDSVLLSYGDSPAATSDYQILSLNKSTYFAWQRLSGRHASPQNSLNCDDSRLSGKPNSSCPQQSARYHKLIGPLSQDRIVPSTLICSGNPGSVRIFPLTYLSNFSIKHVILGRWNGSLLRESCYILDTGPIE